MSLLGTALSMLGATASTSRVPPLNQTASMLSEAVGHRAELAALELDEAGAHARTSLVLVIVASLFGLLAGFALTLTVAGLVWDSPHRAAWLAALAAAYLVAAGIAGWVVRRRFQTWKPFSETRTQLQQDHACLNQIIQSMAR